MLNQHRNSLSVGIDVRKYFDYGIGTYLQQLLAGLDASDTDLCFELLHHGRARKPGPFEHLHHRFIDYSWPRKLPVQRPLPAAFSSPVFHAPHYLCPPVPAQDLILTVHDLIHLHPPCIPKNLTPLGNIARRSVIHAKRRYHRHLSRNLLVPRIRDARMVIAVSGTTADQLIQLGLQDPKKIRVIHNCIDQRFFELPLLTSAGNSSLERPACLPDGDYVLYCGNDLYHKNIPALLCAWKSYKDRFGSCPYLVLAGPRSRTAIQTMADELRISDCLVIPGYIPSQQLPAVYDHSLAVITATLSEGFGLPVAEAMARGKAVICSDIPVLREISRGTALFIDPENPEAIASGLHFVLSDSHLREDLEARGPEIAASYNRREFVKGHLDVYNRVLGRSS